MTYSIYRQATAVSRGAAPHRGVFAHQPPPTTTTSSDLERAEKLLAEALAWGKAMRDERDEARKQVLERRPVAVVESPGNSARLRAAPSEQQRDAGGGTPGQQTVDEQPADPALAAPPEEAPTAPVLQDTYVREDLEAEALAQSEDAQTHVETLMELAAEAARANAKERKARKNGGPPPPHGPPPSPSSSPSKKTPVSHAAAKAVTRGANLTRCYELDGISTCVSPELQFVTPTHVHLVPADSPKAGWRFQHLVRAGFDAHPAIVPVASILQAEFVLYLPVSTRNPPTARDGATPTNLVVLDEGDGAGVYAKIAEHDYLVYLKRSWVTKKDGAYTGTGKRYARNYYPLAYSVSDSYFDASKTKDGADRTLDVLCSNRPTDKQPTRARVVRWVRDFLDRDTTTTDGEATTKRTYRGIAGEINAAGRREINDAYFSAMRNAKIVVTANPSHWEGDFRFFEAVAPGALVFVDEMYVPHPRPFRHGEHLVVFDNSDQAEFVRLLEYYLEHPAEARRIARNGLRHALRYHRAVSRMDYVLRSAHEVARAGATAYTHTARQIAFDVNATTQVDPVVDIARPEMRRQNLDAGLNLGRRHRVPPPLTTSENADLVRVNRERRKRLLDAPKR